MSDRLWPVVVLLGLLMACGAPPSSEATEPSEMVWHVERLDGETIDSRDAESPVNPASVVKVATTLWALERLGGDHRFQTRFGIRGELDRDSGRLIGDLLVEGGADPDFHDENAMLVALALNEAGLREVSGRLIVDDRFWIGWEGGSERRRRDAEERATQMAARLRNALDSARWNAATRRAWERVVERRDLKADTEPAVVIEGGVTRADPSDAEWLVVHHGDALQVTLRRLNAFSNNDIERLGASLGTAGELAEWLGKLAPSAGSPVQLSTLSGLGVNRMTSRRIVGLLRELHEQAGLQDLSVRDLLPVAGCDPGTLEKFPGLPDGPTAGALVAKTGTLTKTDGGVAALAGYLSTVDGVVLFSATRTATGGQTRAARVDQSHWLLDLVSRLGEMSPEGCGVELPYSFDGALISRP